VKVLIKNFKVDLETPSISAPRSNRYCIWWNSTTFVRSIFSSNVFSRYL